MTIVKSDRNRKILIFIFLACVFTFIMCWAVIQPYNVSPDEEMRYKIVEYIIRHGVLPDGRDPEIRNSIWGISYGYYPILSSIIMAVPAKIATFFTSDFMIILNVSRAVNAVFGTIAACLVFRTSEILFKSSIKYVFTALIVFLPQVIFIHSYVNNDSIAFLASAWIFYVCVRSIKEGWTIALCIKYACAVSLCALSYYNVYGFIICSAVFFLATVLIGYGGNSKAKYMSERVLIIVIIIAILVGWWFIRNAVLYDGDLLGLRTSSQQAEIYAMDGFKPSQRTILAEQGYNPINLLIYSQWEKANWIMKVAAGFVGTFGLMTIEIPVKLLIGYYCIYGAGVVGVFTCIVKLFSLKETVNGLKQWNKKGIFHWCMLFVIIITYALIVYYNLYSDVQPQGRYLMPAAIPIMYFVTIGIERLFDLMIKNEKAKDILYKLAAVAMAAIAVYIYVTVFYPEYRG